MTFTNCPECGTPLKWQDANHPTQCPNCGYSFNNNTTTQNENSKKINLISWVIPISIFCFIIAGIFFYKGYDAKNNYHNSEYYTSLNKNAYVGGDAYNYIINGTYFTGYSVIASAFLLSGVMFNINGIKLYNANTEKEKNNVSN